MVKVVICGGSIGGLSTALNLIRCGCEVVVYERASAIHPAGAVRNQRTGYLWTSGAGRIQTCSNEPIMSLQGLGLDPDTIQIMKKLGLHEEFDLISRPLPVEEYRWLDSHAGHLSRSAVPIVLNQQHHHVR